MPEDVNKLSLSEFAKTKTGVVQRQRFVLTGGKASLRYLVDLSEFLESVKLVSSRSEGDSLLHDGAVEVDGVKFNPGPLDSLQMELRAGITISVDRRRFLKLVD